MKKIFLCDGHNLAFRAFYGIRELTRSDGFPTNMIHGWVRSFWRLEDDFSPDEIWVFFDKGGCPLRENILPQYKANRGSPPEGFSEQLEYVKELTGAMGYGWAEKEGLEADDLIATKTMQLKEVKNGRLAMLACGGILHQQLLSKVPTIAFFGDFKPLTIGY